MIKILIQCFFIHFFFVANIIVIMVFPYIMLHLCLIGNLYITSMHFPVLCDQIDEIPK